MLIEAPCRLGEQFEHTRPWGTKGPLYFVGLELFAWHCFMDGVTLWGGLNPYVGYSQGFYSREYLTQRPISFEVPDCMLSNDKGVPLRELGINAEGTGWLGGLVLKQGGEWRYRVSRGRDREAREVRTIELDKLFDPILPAVRLSMADFL